MLTMNLNLRSVTDLRCICEPFQEPVASILCAGRKICLRTIACTNRGNSLPLWEHSNPKRMLAGIRFLSIPEIVLLYYGLSPVMLSADEIYHPIIGAQQRLINND